MKKFFMILLFVLVAILVLASCSLEKQVSVSTRGYETGSMTIGRSKQQVDVTMPSESDYKSATLYHSK